MSAGKKMEGGMDKLDTWNVCAISGQTQRWYAWGPYGPLQAKKCLSKGI